MTKMTVRKGTLQQVKSTSKAILVSRLRTKQADVDVPVAKLKTPHTVLDTPLALLVEVSPVLLLPLTVDTQIWMLRLPLPLNPPLEVMSRIPNFWGMSKVVP